MAEAWFYHLTERTLEATAPELLERCLARGWRAVVRLGDPARLESLDRRLWTYREEGFLPHGSPADGRAERQPIWLTTGTETPNGAAFLMLAAGAEARPEEMARFERTALVFDGADPAALAGAREAWRAATAAGLKAVYWAEEGGRWVKKREIEGGGTT